MPPSADNYISFTGQPVSESTGKKKKKKKSKKKGSRNDTNTQGESTQYADTNPIYERNNYLQQQNIGFATPV